MLVKKEIKVATSTIGGKAVVSDERLSSYLELLRKLNNSDSNKQKEDVSVDDVFITIDTLKKTWNELVSATAVFDDGVILFLKDNFNRRSDELVKVLKDCFGSNLEVNQKTNCVVLIHTLDITNNQISLLLELTNTFSFKKSDINSYEFGDTDVRIWNSNNELYLDGSIAGSVSDLVLLELKNLLHLANLLTQACGANFKRDLALKLGEYNGGQDNASKPAYEHPYAKVPKVTDKSWVFNHEVTLKFPTIMTEEFNFMSEVFIKYPGELIATFSEEVGVFVVELAPMIPKPIDDYSSGSRFAGNPYLHKSTPDEYLSRDNRLENLANRTYSDLVKASAGSAAVGKIMDLMDLFNHGKINKEQLEVQLFQLTESSNRSL